MKKTILILTAIIGIASCSQNSDNTNGNGNGSNIKTWVVNGTVRDSTKSGSVYTQSFTNPNVKIVKTGSYVADSLSAIDSNAVWQARPDVMQGALTDNDSIRSRQIIFVEAWCENYNVE